MPDPSGFLLVDKPTGISSFDVIRRLRKLTGIRRIGHTGTLDPFASGLMVLCFGFYTRLAQYPEADAKTYEATLEFGTQTDSGDLTGEVIRRMPIPPFSLSNPELESLALSISELPVPAYSAIKLAGKRAYEYARKGEEVTMPVRPVTVHAFKVLHVTETSLTYRCTVTKGTYIRSLSEWLAEKLGCIGHTTALRRTGIGTQSVSDAYTLDFLETHPATELFVPPEKILSSLPHFVCDPEQELHLFHGRPFAAQGEDTPALMMLSQSGKLLGIGTRKEGSISPKVNLHL